MPEKSTGMVVRVFDITLTQNDFTNLNPGGWINSALIDTGQALLRKRFPEVCGLQNVVLSKTLTFQLQTGHEFVQILNCANQHRCVY